MPGRQSTRSRSEAMFALAKEYLTQSNVTQRQFCSEHQVAYSTFQLYLGKYRRSQGAQAKTVKLPGQFVPLAFSGLGATAGNYSPCELVWPDGMVIRFGENPSPEYLVALVKAARSVL
jgi:hypothetical protein